MLFFSDCVTHMKKEVTLNNKEQKRLLVLNEVLAGGGQDNSLAMTVKKTQIIMDRLRCHYCPRQERALPLE